MELHKIQKSDYLDILFEYRNKAYGAYDLRRAYNRNLQLAIVITWGVVGLLFLLPRLVAAFAPIATTEKKVVFRARGITIAIPKKKEAIKTKHLVEPQKAAPKATPPKEALPTLAFTPTKVVADKDVTTKEPPRAEDLKQAQTMFTL